MPWFIINTLIWNRWENLQVFFQLVVVSSYKGQRFFFKILLIKRDNPNRRIFDHHYKLVTQLIQLNWPKQIIKNEQQRSTANPKVFHLFNMFSNDLLTLDDLTNRLSFSVDCTFIDNDIRHHSGQNVVDSRGAALWICNKKLIRFITFWIDHKLKKNLCHFEFS